MQWNYQTFNKDFRLLLRAGWRCGILLTENLPPAFKGGGFVRNGKVRNQADGGDYAFMDKGQRIFR